VIEDALQRAIEYADENDIPLPLDVRIKARQLGVIKAGGDLPSITKNYHDRITVAMIAYFEGGSIVSSRNAFKQATIDAFGAAFDLGWTDGGQELPVDDNALDWFNARVNTEFGFIEMLFQEAKELRRDKDFDYFSWLTARADGYSRTLREIYNVGKLRAMDDRMVTFEGDDGAESCDTCQKLKGKRHRLSWFVSRNYVPPFGTGLDCHRGGHCQHCLVDDKGNQVTQ